MDFGVLGVELLNLLVGNVLLGLGLSIEGSALDLALGLEALNNVSVLPADLSAQTSKDGVLPAGAEALGTEGRRDDNALDDGVRRRDTFEDLDAGEGSSSTGSLVGEHSTDGAPQDLGGGAEVEGASARVGVLTLVKEIVVLDTVADERSGNRDALSTDTDDLLTVQGLLGQDGSKATQNVVLAVNDDTLF